MAKVHCVEKARKDNSVCKKGETYYWWSTRITVGKSYVSKKHLSKTFPKRSQLTNSEFLGQMYDIEDDRLGKLNQAGFASAEDLRAEVDSIAEDIRTLGEEQEDKRGNMPEGLQEGSTGEMLQERSNACKAMAYALEAIDFDYDEELNGEFEEWLEGKIDEVNQISYEGP